MLTKDGCNNNTVSLQPFVVIVGLGGIGKTELVKMYSHLRGPNYFANNVIWITSDDQMSLSNSFVNLAQYLGFKVSGQSLSVTVANVYDYFKKRKALFIFDNAETLEDIRPFLPQVSPIEMKPCILITSRNQEWGNDAGKLMLDVLEEYEAVSMVMSSLQTVIEITTEEAKQLAGELQSLPLALQQAVAYIKKFNKRRRFTVHDYIKAFQAKTKDVLGFKIQGSDYTKTVLVTWEMSFDKIREGESSSLASRLIGIMAYLHADDIPFDMFLELTSGDKDLLWDSFDVLLQYSLIKSSTRQEKGSEEVQTLFHIHRLVQKVIQLTLESTDVEKNIENSLRLIQELVSDALLYQGRYFESLDYVCEEYFYLEENLGPGHHATLALVFNKARSLHCIGKHREALPVYNEAITRYTSTIGELHCDTLAAKIDLGFLHIDLEEPEIALSIFQDVYEKKLQLENAKIVCTDGIELYKYRDVYTALYGIGHALQLLERYEEAEKLYAKFYEQRRITDGEDHPRRLHAGNKLAEVLIKQKRHSEAQNLLKDIYERQLSKLDDTHPHCMSTLANIVECMKINEEFEEAAIILNDLYLKRCKVLGADHKDTLKISNMMKKLKTVGESN
eukprot:gene5366-544_t